MNLLDFFVKSYGHFHDYKNVPFWVMTPFRRVLRKMANAALPHYLPKIQTAQKRDEVEIIVSFTSFPARIDMVWQVVLCMLKQTLPPQKIILWLSRKQFSGDKDIPLRLKELQGEVFQIRFVDGDIRSHKKYYYVSKEYPDSLIFLIDDDIYYPTDIIERSYNAYLKHKDSIICNYGYQIGYYNDGRLKPYREWKHVYSETVGNNLFFGSGAGTLFKPSFMHNDLTNIELALELTPRADDIWLNAMAKLAMTPVCILSPGLYLPIISDTESLKSINNGESYNDVQLKSVEAFYGKCF